MSFTCMCARIKAHSDSLGFEFSQSGRENGERGRELKMNTSEASLVLFLENSYPVNQKRKI